MATAASDTSLEELQTRLVTFTEQLQNIHELLQTDPENAEFLGIAADLVEVVRLTKEAIDLKLGGNTASASGYGQPEGDEQQPTGSNRDAPELLFMPGAVVEAQSKGTWFPAYVESLTASDTYNVVYFGFGNRDELPASSLRAIDVDSKHVDLPDKAVIAEGFKCEAKYYVDSQYYTCSVTNVTAHGFQVLFDGYGNSEEVPYEYLRPVAAVADAAPSAAAPAASRVTAAPATSKPAAAVIDKPIKIPENLQILPTDTEAEKERKRKRIRAIKSLNRHKNIDNERNLKQHGWKVFQHKATKKKVKGASGVLSKRGTSMFASPDTVAGRVGVVGSGQGMTEYTDARKKLKRNPGAPGAPHA